MITVCTDNRVGRFQTFYGTVLCNEDGCFGKAGHISGYCKKHYYSIWSGCKPREFKNCSAEGCDKKHWQHGYCRTHWARVERLGSPKLKPKFERCIIEGCKKKVYKTKGYCQMHLYRIKHKIPLKLSGRSNKGKRNGRWNGGISEYPNHYEMKLMRKIVLEEENYTCHYCGKPTKQVHHKDLSRDNHKRENLTACCNSCNQKMRKSQTSKYIRMYGHTLKQLKVMGFFRNTTVKAEKQEIQERLAVGF